MSVQNKSKMFFLGMLAVTPATTVILNPSVSSAQQSQVQNAVAKNVSTYLSSQLIAYSDSGGILRKAYAGVKITKNGNSSVYSKCAPGSLPDSVSMFLIDANTKQLLAQSTERWFGNVSEGNVKLVASGSSSCQSTRNNLVMGSGAVKLQSTLESAVTITIAGYTKVKLPNNLVYVQVSLK